MLRWVSILLLMVSFLGVGAGPAGAGQRQVMVFAAASTTNALERIGELFGDRHSLRVVNSFASSSTLAKQIARGAPADVFLSANPQWMDYLEDKGLLARGSRVELLGNRLVLIAPRSSRVERIRLRRGLDLSSYLHEGPLAMGDPSHVPAGIYGKQALEGLGMWKRLRGRVAAAANVRVALAMVELGEAPLGIVYRSDALVSRKVKVVATFPAWCHAPIVYPVAVLAGRERPEVRAYMAFLRGREAAEVFHHFGFETK